MIESRVVDQASLWATSTTSPSGVQGEPMRTIARSFNVLHSAISRLNRHG
ncbi:MAG: hypothetical protein ACRECP_04825 [Methylocella sp.]